MKMIKYVMLFFVAVLVSPLMILANEQTCGASGEKAEQLKAAGDFSTAMWCYANAKNWPAVVALEKHIKPEIAKRMGDGNYALVTSQLALAHLELKNLSAGRRALENGMKILRTSPEVIHTAYNVALLFQDNQISFAERQKWHTLFMEVMKHPRPGFQLADCFSNNVYFGVDQGVREGKTNQAFAMARDAIEEHEPDLMKHWGIMRDMIRIQYLALKHEQNPRAVNRRLKMLFLVIPETKLEKSPEQFGNVDEKLRDQDMKDLLLNFRYFNSVFQSLTGIAWDSKIMRHPGKITRTTFTPDPPRTGMHPLMDSVQPALSPAILREIAASDGVTLIWAGVRQPPDHLITNGTGTEWEVTVEGRPMHRLFIASDSNKRFIDGHHANSALFFFHETFHVFEWAYYKSAFPKENHPYSRRGEWPADYVGSTEWDFYYETYTKRFVPEDGMARIEWRSNHGGFHNRKMRGE